MPNRTLESPYGAVTVARGRAGVPTIRSGNLQGAYYGLGFAQARDRLMQVWFSKYLAEGRVAEMLGRGESLVRTDRYLRGLRLKRPVRDIAEPTLGWLTAFAQGVNAGVDGARRPLASYLLRPRSEPWTIADSLATIRLMGYVGLGDVQIRAELSLARIIQGNRRAFETFKVLLSPHLDNYDPSWVNGVDLAERVLGVGLDEDESPARGSNNWAVSGARTRTGKPILCNDPHLTVSRLPSVWYEAVIQTPEVRCAGMTVPGVPAFIFGGNEHAAWGITYAETDATDAFVEDCADGRYRKDGAWLPFETREETIVTRGGGKHRVIYHENDHGLLLGDPRIAGRYLAVKWSGADDIAQRSIEAVMRLPLCTDVRAVQDAASRIDVPSLNWVIADVHGDIGYQMSGLIPRRPPGVSGILPLPGWHSRYDWQGFLDPEELPRETNPDTGYVATANNTIGGDCGQPVQTLAFPSDRVERIAELLAASRHLDIAAMKTIQLDLHSPRADRVLRWLRPFLENHPQGDTLLRWDRCYTAGSRAATLFHLFCNQLTDQVCSGLLCDKHTWHEIVRRSPLFGMLYRRIEEEWSAPDGLFAGVNWQREVDGAFSRLPRKIRPWGRHRRFRMRHILLGHTMIGGLIFNRGPFAMDGASDTINVGSVGGGSANGVSARLIADLGERKMESILPGGPSGKPLSRHYGSEIRRWLKGHFKTLIDWNDQQSR